MFCTNCGNQMPDGSKFCTKCGAPMGALAPEVPAEGASAGGADAGDAPAHGGATQGAAAAAGPSPAPSKKKRTGLVVGIAATVVVALAAVGIAVANPFAAPAPEPELGSVQASDPQPAPEPAPEPESDPTAEPALAIPNRYFISSTNFHPSGAYDVCLTDLEGNEVVFENPDMRPMGGFSEGKVLVTWETSEYDEEWDTEFDEMTHYGLVDATGALVVDLTDLVHGYGYTFQGNLQDASVTNSPTYADGRLVLFIE